MRILKEIDPTEIKRKDIRKVILDGREDFHFIKYMMKETGMHLERKYVLGRLRVVLVR